MESGKLSTNGWFLKPLLTTLLLVQLNIRYLFKFDPFTDMYMFFRPNNFLRI